jgi:hypothetical protein
MPVAVATIGRMAERITLEQVAQGINDLGTIIHAGFAYNETKFGEVETGFKKIDVCFTVIEKHMEKEFGAVKDRLGTVEYGILQIQKDFVSLDEEIRGIHKIIDHLNIRLMALERNFGAAPLFPAG